MADKYLGGEATVIAIIMKFMAFVDITSPLEAYVFYRVSMRGRFYSGYSCYISNNAVFNRILYA